MEPWTIAIVLLMLARTSGSYFSVCSLNMRARMDTENCNAVLAKILSTFQ
jgi:hypothetical protein